MSSEMPIEENIAVPWDLTGFSWLMAALSKLGAAVQGTGLSVDSVIILVQLKSDGRTTAGVLADELGFSRARVGRLVADLLDAGLAAEHLLTDDLRFNHLRITNRGENLLFEMAHIFPRDGLVRLFEGYVHLCRGIRAGRLAGVPLGLAAAEVLIVLQLSDGASVGQLAEALSMD